jgi:16S rRNA (adenine1518-N6/adenine1519-N6)-dimethyltransferase
VQASFAQRRKTLRNNLKGLIDGDGLEVLGIDPSARAETLELTQFIGIANAIGGRDRSGTAHLAAFDMP